MTAGRNTVLQRLRRAALAHEGGPGDAELMERFTARRDADALAALVRRHGPMVLAACRRVLGDGPDAEDAFQAAFLVFVRKAASIRSRELVGPWLYGVAYRTALKAKGAAARRRVQERRAATMKPVQADSDDGWAEWLPMLDRELDRLPEKYRMAIVLCELEGRPRKEAAHKLGVPEGTLSSRLATGKRLLARRLAGHGPAPAGCVLAAVLARGTSVPPVLLTSTAKAASLFAAGRAATAVASTRVAALAEGVLKTMLLTKLAVAVLAAVAVAAVGSAAFACRTPPAPAAVAPAAPGETPMPDKEKADWGEAEDGVQVRLRPNKEGGEADEPREFILDARNQGEKIPSQCRVPDFCEMEWDGQWYQYGGTGRLECKSTALEPAKEIDEWVKLSLDMPWVQKGARDKRLQITAGKHTVRVRLVLADPSTLSWIRPVSRPVQIEEGKESAWGEAADGVRARLRVNKISWDIGESPEFVLDMRNGGEKPHGACRVANFCEVEWDGRWYQFAGKGDLDCKSFLLEPGKEIDDWVKPSLDIPWVRKPDPKPGDPPSIGSVALERLRVEAGRHTMRVAFLFDGGPRVVSQPLALEVGKESAWGDAAGGVQARLRMAKAVWKAGEPVRFHLDLRNQGKATANARRVPVDCQIEVDGTWYSYDLPSGPYPAVGDPLEPGKEVDEWTNVLPDNKDWSSRTPRKDRFQLQPGKHTIRIAYPLNGEKGPIRPVSGPVEIDVQGEQAWGEAVDGVQARLRPGKTAWDLGDASEFVLDVRNQGEQTPQACRVPLFCEIEWDGEWYVHGGPFDLD